MPDATSASVGKTEPLRVQNMSFMLEKLGADCAPLQHIRELTQNAIEAISKTPDGTGKAIWDVEWNYWALEGVFKLSVTDNGIGMTGEEMEKYINQLSSSSSEQSHQANYGVGAKISAGTRNTFGMVYLSWKDGKGSQIVFWKDPETGVYGLRPFTRRDGMVSHWATLSDDLKPDLIEDHGTQVILLGKSSDDDTMAAPDFAKVQTKWIRKYLNSRYARFPDGIEVRAREGWEHPRSDTDRNVTRGITGQIPYLNEHKEAAGIVNLSGAVARWWILKDEKALAQNSSQIESTGHMAALYQDELYELRSGRSATAALQNFGVIFGQRRVVIYVEPTTEGNDLITTNISRTNLLIASEPLTWADWGHEFRENMPEEIVDYMEKVAAGAEATDHAESIQNRLKQIEEFFKLPRYRPTPEGLVLIDPLAKAPGGSNKSAQEGGGTGGGSGGGGKGGRSALLYSLFQSDDGVKGESASKNPYPVTQWVSIEDGTREPGNMEDRAATYIADSHTLLINRDFRVFNDMTKRWERKYKDKPGSKLVIEDVVREWFEQSLVEAVMCSFGLKGSSEWTTAELDKMLSSEGLTAVTLPRYHIDQNIRRALGTKLGTLKTAAA